MNEKQILKMLEKVKELENLREKDASGSWTIKDHIISLEGALLDVLKSLVWARYQMEHNI